MSRKTHHYKTMRLGYSDRRVAKMLRRGWTVVTISGGGLGSARVATFSKPKKGHEDVSK